jgi:hypothetical protein
MSAAAHAGELPQYPGAVDPLQLDSLLPDGKQFTLLKDTYEQDKEHGWAYGRPAGVTDEEMQQLKDMLVRNKGAFAYSMQELPGYTGEKVHIDLKHDNPIISMPRRYSKLEDEIQEEKCAELKAPGFIEPANHHNNYASCPTMPAKKDEHGNWVDRRYCIDFRRLNEATAANRYGLELPEKLFQKVEGRPFLSSIDLKSGFHQLVLDDETKKYTAFWWGKTLWQYTRMCYGLRNATAVFQATMDKVLGDAGLNHCAGAYVDDVMIASPDLATHITDVEAVLQALHKVGLRVHPGKSVFGADKIEYLGHVITPGGIEPQAAKVAAMANLPVPTNVPQLQSVLGLLNYYRVYLVGFSTIAKPLNRLLQQGVPFVWGVEQQEAFDTLKRMLCTEGLALKRADPDKPFILHTDWSQHGIGAVLAQLDDDQNEYMVACASRSLNIHERNYTPWKGELLAVVWGIKTFRPYLHGVHFELVTDHRPLLWLLSQPEPTGQHARWVLSIMEYDYCVRHRAGVDHVNADVLSRYPYLGHVDGTGAQLDNANDPLRAPLPKVVFGPPGTGTPAFLPDDQIIKELPPDQVQQRPPKKVAFATPPAAKGTSCGPAPAPVSLPAAPSGHPVERPKHNKKKHRKKHMRLQVAQAERTDVSDFVALASLQVTAAAAKAEHAYRCFSTAAFDCMTEYVCSELEPWELPHSQWADPLAAVSVQPWAKEDQLALRHRATQWVAKVPLPMPAVATPPRSPASLDITPITASFFSAASQGLIVFEPFGGLCSGLETVLRNDLPVAAYFYSDIDPVAREIAAYRLQLLQERYPGLLPPTALQATFTALPQDVWRITNAQLRSLSQRFPKQWLVVGGWECQDLSPAGNGKGITGPKSSTIAPFVNIIAQLQLLQTDLPPGYIMENTAMQYNTKVPHISQQQYNLICTALGKPVCVDATRLDSYAHRVRDFWTNLCSTPQLQVALDQARRTPGLEVKSVITPASGREPAPVVRDDRAVQGRYPANKAGQPRSAWPTLVAYKGSRAFRPGQPGEMTDPDPNGPREPDAHEREQALGYNMGDTQAPGVTEQQRCTVLGRCIDANVLQSVVAVAAAWYRKLHWGQEPVGMVIDSTSGWVHFQDEAVAALAVDHGGEAAPVEPTLEQYLVALAAAAATESQEKGLPDIWKDQHTLTYLKEQRYSPDWSPAVKDRVFKRAASYIWQGDGRLRRLSPDGAVKIVPKPEERKELINQCHTRCGHYGVRRTGALLQHSYWWWGMWADVAVELSKCALCSRGRGSFKASDPKELHPLPISGLMYRWGVDLFGPLPETPRGHKYVMVAIEHFSKHVELVPLPNKEPTTTATAFTAAVLGRYGCPAEVLSDRGGEWMEAFDRLLLACMIDHRRTSALHPPANGLSERAVQTMKLALEKLCAAEGTQFEWDLHLPWLMLGYNASPQKSTGMSPYQLIHAVVPTVPPAIREKMQEPINLDDPEKAAADFLRRFKLVKERTIMAGDNLRIAQHRDTLRYAKLRSAGYTPQLRRFQPGDYVWVKRKDRVGLDLAAQRHILRVREVKPSGVLVLQGRCGGVTAVHMSRCTPCHLPNISPAIDWSLGKPPAEAVCEQCGSDAETPANKLIFCDNCNSGWHLHCCQPELSKVPRGTWVCQGCEGQGIDKGMVEGMQQLTDKAALEQQQPEKFLPAEIRARQLDGRYLRKRFTADGQPGNVRWYTGRVHFRGRLKGGNLLIVYEDGDAEVTTMQSLRADQVEWLPEGTAAPAGLVFKAPAQAEAEVTQRAAARTAAAATGPRRSGRQAAQRRVSTNLAAGTPGSVSSGSSSRGATAGTPAPSVATTPVSHPSPAPVQQGRELQHWDLSTTSGIQSALAQLMPGDMALKDVTRLANVVRRTQQQARTGIRDPGASSYVPTDPAEVTALLEALDFTGCSSFLDPFAGSGTIASVFGTQGYQVTQNDIDPFWRHATRADALQPLFYNYQPPQVVVTSPPFELLDIALPLLAEKAKLLACVHVPGHWLTNARVPRQHWIAQLQAQGRLLVLLGLPRGPTHQRCLWVVVGREAGIIRQLSKQQQEPGASHLHFLGY